MLSFNHLWISSHRLLEPQEAQICHFTMTSGNDSLQMRTDRKQTKKAVLLCPLSGWSWAFPLSLPPSPKRLPRPRQPVLCRVTRSRIHFSGSQLFSAGPTTTSRVPANVLAEWHLPPGAADTEARRTSLFGSQITQSFPTHHCTLSL